MSYRYQEALIADLLRSLRAFRARLVDSVPPPAG